MKSMAVQRQAEAAEKLHEEVYGGEDGAETENDGVQEPEQQEEAPEKSNKATPEEQPRDDAGGEPEPAGEPLEESAAAASPEGWEQKYRTLQGMYNAEVPRLQGAVRELVEKNQGMEAMLASMQLPSSDDATSQSSLLSAEEIEDYGEDMIGVVKKAAREEIGNELATLQNENRMLRQQVGSVASKTQGDAVNQFYSQLASQVPNWAEVNKEKEFLVWLSERDAYSGQPRQEMLNVAFKQNDAARVAVFFRGYLNDRQITAPTSDQEAAAAAPQPTANLDTLVAPGSANVSVSSAPAQGAGGNGKIYSSGEVQAFYRDVQRGVYRDDPASKNRVEKAIIKAGREGRIQ